MTKPIYIKTVEAISSRIIIYRRQATINVYCHCKLSTAASNRVKQLLLDMDKKKGAETKQNDGGSFRYLKYRQKLGGKLPTPGIIDVQVIGSGAVGCPKSVLIATDHLRYLFNCGEGTQRIIAEHKMKLSRMENIFITHKSWQNIGGLMGLALTLEGVGVTTLGIHGPANVEKIIGMAKSFSNAADINIVKHDVSAGRHVDAACRVDYVCLSSSEPTSSASYCDSAERSRDDEQRRPHKRRCRSSERTERNNVAVAYICRPHAAPRKMLMEKCIELGLTASYGKLLGQLVAGESVTLNDGKVIHPDQVLSPTEPPKPIIVVECPSEHYLDSLLSSNQLCQTQASCADVDSHARLVVHMTSADVFNHQRYRLWMSRFSPQTEHLILNGQASRIAHSGLYHIQAILSMLDNRIFPLLPAQIQQQQEHIEQMQEETSGEGSETEQSIPEFKASSEIPESRDNSETLAATGLRFHYRPNKGFDRSQCIILDTEASRKEALEQPEVEDAIKRLKAAIADKENDVTMEETTQDSARKQFPEVVFFGTGSSVPSKVRNVTCILVHLDAQRTMLMDCGEGSLSQLYRFYGDETSDILRRICCVFVSHMHADHHLGLFGIVQARERAFASINEKAIPITLLSPLQISRWLKFYNSQVEPVSHLLRLVPLQDLLPERLTRPGLQAARDSILAKLNMEQIVPVEVKHCWNAFGVVLKHVSGWKLVYSGDTMPCERLVSAGMNCDLLIHEATMEDDLEEEARIKTHSTTSQAIDIGMRMKARFTLLTHFSQRYAKIPVLNANLSSNVGIAFDNMKVHFSDLPSLPEMLTPLKAIFAEEHAELEDRKQKRLLRQLRENKNVSLEEMVVEVTGESTQKLTVNAVATGESTEKFTINAEVTKESTQKLTVNANGIREPTEDLTINATATGESTENLTIAEEKSQ